MWAESYDIPDNTFSGLNIQLPLELKQWVINETHNELLECSIDIFIESLWINWWNDVFTSMFHDNLRSHLINKWKLDSKLDSANIQKTLRDTITEIESVGWLEFVNLKENISQSYIVINWVSLNYSRLFTNYASNSILRPKSREEIENSQVKSLDEYEPEGWFQRDEKWGWFNLSDLIKEVWISENLSLFLTQDLLNMKISPEWFENIGLLVRYIAEAESWGWYNRVHDEGFPGSGWYFEYQKNDWKNAWEKLDSDGNYQALLEKPSVVDSSVREVWLDSSYDMALRRIPAETVKFDEQLQLEIKGIWTPEYQNMANLSAEQQIIVLLSDLYGDPQWPDLFKLLIEWDRSAITEIYTKIHHTDLTNPKTAQLVNRLNRDILWIYPRPLARPKDLWNDLIAQNN